MNDDKFLNGIGLVLVAFLGLWVIAVGALIVAKITDTQSQTCICKDCEKQINKNEKEN